MADKSLLISNISRLVTMDPADGREGRLGVIEDAAVRIEGDRIAWLGRAAELPLVQGPEQVIDAAGCVVMPGLVDCHTHLVHAGFRQNEFNLRSQGKSYQEIAAAGGGIMSTVAATRAASAEELLESASMRACAALSHGVTTIEIKTGYGLEVKTEAKMADVISRLRKNTPQTILGTQLGAHVVPPEYRDRRSEYLQMVIGVMMPNAARSGAVSACDAFVEEGAFTKDEARAVAGAGKILGLALHLHADQFTSSGGGELAAEMGALSADHLDEITDKGISAMASKGVVGVVLPGASFFAGRGHYPDARKMIDLGLTVAMATDYNPGTNPSLDPWMSASIGITQMGLSCDEALAAITRNAAAALGLSDRGRIAAGLRADLVLLDAPDEYFPLYRYGMNFVKQVIIGGERAS
ncbi:MAG: imidazolonepropionase [bacterium]